jgi:hypothetical protein
MPEYVEYGSLATVPGPLRCEGVRQWCFPLEADPDRLDALCRKVFAEPTGGELDLRPLGTHVIFTLGRVDRIVSEPDPFDRMGWATEGQSAIWIPVGRVRQDGEHLLAEDVLMFTPYMWVDNPISLSSGREMYGFAKAFGWIELPDSGDEDQAFGLDVFGMNFDRDEDPSRRALLRVARGERVHELADIAWTALHDAGRHVRNIVSGGPAKRVGFGLRFADSVARDLLDGGVRQVFMRQARAVGDGRQAALQQVTEARYRVTSMHGAPLEHEYSIDLSPLDSHPLGAELGLGGRMLTRSAFRTESTFVLEAGRIAWDSAVSTAGKAEGAAPAIPAGR